MKQFKLISIIILGACAMLFSACDLLAEPPSPPVPALPTVATGSKVDTTKPVITEPVAEPTQVAIVNPIATEQPSDESPIEQPTFTPTPATVNNGCLAPPLPDDLMYASYVVQPGDTLFKIGLAAKPQMTVDEVAAANCIENADQIEVGQTILIHTTKRSIGAHEEISFVEGPYGRIGRYNGLLENGSLSFQIEAYGDEDLTVFSHTGKFPEISFQVARKSDLLQIDTFKTTERHYVNTDLRGKHVDLPGGGTYLIMATGDVNALLRLEFKLGGPTFPKLGDPVELTADNLLGFPVQGTNNIGEYDTYQFWGTAGDILDLQPLGEESSNLVMILENSAEQVVLAPPMGRNGQLMIPDTGLYTLYLFHGGSHDFLYGDYSFSLILTQSNPVVVNDAGRIQFAAGTSATNLVGENGENSIDKYTFTASARQVVDISILSDDNTGLWIEDMAGNRITDLFSPATSQFLLPVSGDYHLFVFHGGGHGFWPGPYEIYFGIFDAPAPVVNLPEPTPLQYIPGTKSANIVGQNTEGTVDRFSFSAAAGDEVQLTIGDDANVGAWIEDEAGNRILNLYGPSYSSMLLPMAGNYILNIYHGGSEDYLAGPYNVSIFIVDENSPAPAEPLPLTDGKAKTEGQLDQNGTKKYTLALESGNYVRISGLSADRATYVLKSSSGAVHSGDFNDGVTPSGDAELFVSGNYTLIISGEPNMEFELFVTSKPIPDEPVAGPPQRITFDPVTNTIYRDGTNSNGQLDQFVFAATAGQTLTFDIAHIADQMIIRLKLMDSNQNPIMIVQTRSDGIVDSYQIPETGDYYLVVMEPSNALNRYGSYAFALTLN